MAMRNEIPEDTVILTENGINRQMYMVTSGTVALYVNYGKADEYLLGLCNKGTVFGEMGVLCHAPSIYTAVTVTVVVVATFSEFELDYFVKTYPDQALGIMKSTTRMNNILSLNLKMTLNEMKEEHRLNEILSNAMKTPEELVANDKPVSDDAPVSDDKPVAEDAPVANDKPARWRYHK